MKFADYMQKYTSNKTVGAKNKNSDDLPAEIGKNTDNNRYWLSLINNAPNLMKFTEYMQKCTPNNTVATKKKFR